MYENPIKYSWRCWAWKQLKERLPVHPRFATAMFLCGPTVLDLPSAIRNGFRFENLIAVDLNEANIANARQHGLVGICATIENAVSQFNECQIHAVLADYCGGMSAERYVAAKTIVNQTRGGCVLNFQRGRESSPMSKMFRETMKEHGIDDKHRGVQFLWARAMEGWHIAEHGPEMPEEMYGGTDNYLSVLLSDVKYESASHEIREMFNYEYETLKPKFHSYRANNVYMDSIAVTNKTPTFTVQHKQYLNKLYNTLALRRDAKSERIKMSRKLSAMKAVRTMNGSVRVD